MQALEEKKFTLGQKLGRRRHQLAQFDEGQMELIDHRIDPNELRLAQLVNVKYKNAKLEGSKNNHDDEKCTTRTVSFITQLNHGSLPTSPSAGNKANTGSPHVKFQTSPSTTAKTKNDYRLLYDYNAYFRALTAKNEKNMKKHEKERVLSKKWFIQLLKRVKIYKIR